MRGWAKLGWTDEWGPMSGDRPAPAMAGGARRPEDALWPASAEPVGVGLVGCGAASGLHLRALASLEHARLVALADVRPERAAERAAEFDALLAVRGRSGSVGREPVAVYPDLDGLLSDPRVELVDVCTPSGTHAALGATALAAGRHVLVEKPIDVSLSAATDLLAAWRRAGRQASVVSQHRFDDGSRRLASALAAGRLGRVVLGEGQAHWWRTQAYYDADAWRGTWVLDGGALSNQGVHLVDQLCWLLGPVEAVFARADTVAHRMEAEDVLVATLRFQSGALGGLVVTTATKPGAPETLFVGGTEGSVLLRAGAVVDWVVAGDEAILSAGTDPAGTVSGRAGVPQSAATGSGGLATEAHRRQLADVLAAVRTGRPPSVSLEDGWRALAVIDAAYRSVESGVEERVRPLPAADEAPVL